jgi:HSP20 family molecular chaperone IbpA
VGSPRWIALPCARSAASPCTSGEITAGEGVNASAIHADLRDGVLSVVLPKKAEAQPKKIPVATELVA